MIKFKKHGRFWAVHLDGALLAMVVYKKGAQEIKRVVEGLIRDTAIVVRGLR